MLDDIFSHPKWPSETGPVTPV